MLSPLPVRRCSVAKRRAALSATVLIASPYKKTLEEKLEKKTNSSTRKRVTGKQTSKQGVTQAKSRDKVQSPEVTTPKMPAVKQNRTLPTSSRPIIKPPKEVSRRLDLPRKPSWLQRLQEGKIPNKKRLCYKLLPSALPCLPVPFAFPPVDFPSLALLCLLPCLAYLCKATNYSHIPGGFNDSHNFINQRYSFHDASIDKRTGVHADPTLAMT